MGDVQTPAVEVRGENPPWRTTLIVGGLLVLAGLLAYANSFSVPLLLDDWPTLRGNAQLRHLWPIWDIFNPPAQTGVGGRPMANLSFVMNYAVTGDSLAGFHVVNVAIHVLAGLALYGGMRRTLLLPRLRERFGADATWLAAGVAVLWLLHPVQTESVTYLSQRTEELMGLFYFAALYGFIRAIEKPAMRWRILAILSCGAGMATKEGMATLPVVAFLYDYVFVTQSFAAAWKARRALYAGLAVWWLMLGGLMTGLHARGVGEGFGMSSLQYARTECGAILHYLGLILWPSRLVFDYGTDLGGTMAGWALAPAVVIAGVILTAIGLWRARAVGFLAGWFLITLAPTSSFVPIALQPISENRVYLPLAGVIAAIVLGTYRGNRRAGMVLAGGAAVGLGLLAAARNHDYRSEVSIWADTAAKLPESSRAHNNLGQALQGFGRIGEAKAEYETALRLRPNYADAHANLASIYGIMGQNDRAEKEAREALEIDPALPLAHYNLGIALIHAGRLAEAVVELLATLQRQPGNFDAHNWLALAYLQLHQPAEALTHAQAALALNPGSADVLYRGGCALAEMGKFADAANAFAGVLRLQPQYPDAHYALGTALMQSGHAAEAITSLQNAVQANPNAPMIHCNLGVAYSQVGKTAEAIAELEAALRLDPNFQMARENLQQLRASQAGAGRK